MEAIVLAGGLGTRLRSVLPDLPKSLAPLHGRPFLALLLDRLDTAGFSSVTLAIGYRGDLIREQFGERYGGLTLRYSVEYEPLGTGGAIRLALGHTGAGAVFVLNGDTYVDLDYGRMWSDHRYAGVDLTVAVHRVDDACRYGALDIQAGRIRGFFEKGRSGPGTINAGVYLMERNLLTAPDLPPVFSFENDFLVPRIAALRVLAFAETGLFIDIGVPEDYARAERVLGPRMP